MVKIKTIRAKKPTFHVFMYRVTFFLVTGHRGTWGFNLPPSEPQHKKKKTCPEPWTCRTVWEPDDVWSSVTVHSKIKIELWRPWTQPGVTAAKTKMTEDIWEQNTVSHNLKPRMLFPPFVKTVYQIFSSHLNTLWFSELNSECWSHTDLYNVSSFVHLDLKLITKHYYI